MEYQTEPQSNIVVSNRTRTRKKSGAQVLLSRASELMETRGKEYDKPGGERSVPAIVTAFNAISGKSLTEAEGWLFLTLLKQVRLFNRPGFHTDSAEDTVAYAALMGEAKAKEAISE